MERESIGPRRLREGRVRPTTLPFGEHSMPRHTAEQASAPVQLVRRLPWVSVWRRNSVSASVSFCPAASAETQRMHKHKASVRIMRQRQTCFMLWCGKGGNDGGVFNLKEISDLGLANAMRI